MAYITDRPMEILSVTKNPRITQDNLLLDVIVHDKDPRGYENDLAVEVWNPSDELKAQLKAASDGGSHVMFQGAARSRKGENGNNYFTSVVAFNTSIVILPKGVYKPPAAAAGGDF